MNLNQLIQDHKISLKKESLRSCRQGLEIMSKSIDPHHDLDHVERLFDYLSFLLKSLPDFKTKINFDVLIPSICWHDASSTKKQIHNIFELIWHQVVEGRLSAQLFLEFSSKHLETHQLNLISYCIKKHSSVQLIPPRTLEAKILVDLDKLDMWNKDRFINRADTYVSRREFYQKYLVKFYLRYSKYMGMYFPAMETQLTKHFEDFWHDVHQGESK